MRSLNKSRRLYRVCAWMLLASCALTGCQPIRPHYINESADLTHFLDAATEIEYADVQFDSLEEVKHCQAPRTILNPTIESFVEMSLEEAVSLTLQNSKVFRSFGTIRNFGQINGLPAEGLTISPDASGSIYDVAIQETGNTGVEQALAQFDAVFSNNATWNRNDRPQNVNALSNLAQVLQQDQVTINTELTKQTAYGTQWTFRNTNTYDDNNQTTRALPSDWLTTVEAEVRHPLLRGRGAQVNRIPIVLARIRTDLSLGQFEINVRELVNQVERAYWELYFFYGNLEAAQIGRDSALATHRRISALYQVGDATKADESQSREQYYRFRSQVETALRDLHRQENRLRTLIGWTPTDGRMIRPSDVPTDAKVSFDWSEIQCESLIRSIELRNQKWRIKQRELELIAARNQLLPQLDLVGLYRWLGQGDNLDSFNRTGIDFPAVGSTAVDELLDGDFQEGQLGVELTMTLGFRAELAQVRNQQLLLARERARLEDQELLVLHQLTDAVQDLDAQYQLMQTNLNRRVSAESQVQAEEAAFDASQEGTQRLFTLLNAQQNRSDAIAAYYQSLVQYNQAIMQVHFRKGSLLELNGIVLAEGPWPQKAYVDAHELARRRDASAYMNYGYSRPKVISRGPVQQHTGGSDLAGDVSIATNSEQTIQPFPDTSSYREIHPRIEIDREGPSLELPRGDGVDPTDRHQGSTSGDVVRYESSVTAMPKPVAFAGRRHVAPPSPQLNNTLEQPRNADGMLQLMAPAQAPIDANESAKPVRVGDLPNNETLHSGSNRQAGFQQDVNTMTANATLTDGSSHRLQNVATDQDSQPRGAVKALERMIQSKLTGPTRNRAPRTLKQPAEATYLQPMSQGDFSFGADSTVLSSGSQNIRVGTGVKQNSPSLQLDPLTNSKAAPDTNIQWRE